METVLFVLVGLAGGLVLALLIAGRRQGTPSTFVPRRLAAPSASLINMAHIRVEGVGGLGLVIVAVAVAIVDPRIRLTLIIAAVLGTGLALVMIALRRRNGALPSGGDGPDDRSLLHPEGDPSRTDATDARGAGDPVERARLPKFLDARI